MDRLYTQRRPGFQCVPAVAGAAGSRHWRLEPVRARVRAAGSVVSWFERWCGLATVCVPIDRALLGRQ